MDRNEAEVRIIRLREQLRAYSNAYYNEGASQIPDEVYDSLKRELGDIEAQFPGFAAADSPTLTVGAPVAGNFKKVRHTVPMLSLDNAFGAVDVRNFHNQAQTSVPGEDLEYVGELKIDGLSIDLRYEDGRFAQGVTRGDGEEGDDVTENVRTIRSVPKMLKPIGGSVPAHLRVRGEVYMTEAAFEEYNAKLKAQGKSLAANPRNLASGSLNRKDPAEVAKRPLDAFVYFLIELDDAFVAHLRAFDPELGLGTHEADLRILETLGFTVNPKRVVGGLEDVLAWVQSWQDVEKRKALGYGIDGAVFKVNQKHLWPAIGATGHHPRWATAYKFPAERATAVVARIAVETGRTGKATPVAEFTVPVLLGGTRTQRATLHNEDFIVQRDVRVGDTVTFFKAGEIIPYVERVLLEFRPEGTRGWRFATHCPNCPECDTRLERPEGEADYRCPNDDCPAKVERAVRHFVSRDGMDIRGLGEEQVAQLFEAGMIGDAGDLYSLKAEDLTRLEGWGKVKAQKLISALHASKQPELRKFIYALGIRMASEGTAKRLARRFGTIDAIVKATVDGLMQTEDVGPVVAQNLYAYFQGEAWKTLWSKLQAAGVNPKPEEAQTEGGKLTGLTIVATGTLSRWGRKDIEKFLEGHGAKVSGSVSRKTSLVLVGTEPGKNKTDAARELGIRTLSEEEFVAAYGF